MILIDDSTELFINSVIHKVCILYSEYNTMVYVLYIPHDTKNTDKVSASAFEE